MAEMSFSAELWRHPGQGGWHFLTLPPEVSDEIADLRPRTGPGFGAIRVQATVGGATWPTMVVPGGEQADGAYLLPVKAPVRRSEGLDEGDEVAVRLVLLD